MKKGKIIVSLLLSMVLTVSVLFIGVSAEDKYAAGDLVTLGTYPQSMVTDEQLITELNSLPLDWVSYGYYYWYSFNGDYEIKSEEQDWMKYVDVEHGDEKYRGVLIEEYRQLMNPHYQDIAGQKDYGFELNKIYWFKYEPLIWRVIDPEEGILISEYVIDSQQINEKYYYNSSRDYATSNKYTDAGWTRLNVDDYSQSSLRSWLNEAFVKTAFSNEEQELLISRELNNKPTVFTGEIYEYPGYEYYCTTNDKVSLLSVGELLEWRDNIGTLEAVSTDYSYSQGRQVNTPEWTLRTPIFDTLEQAYLHNVNVLFGGCDTCPAVRVYRDICYTQTCAVCKSEERYGWPLFTEFFYQIPALRPVIKIDLDSAELSPEEPTTEEPTTEEPTTEEPTTEEPTTEEPTTEEPTTEEPTTEEPTTEEPTTEEPTTEEPTTEEPTTEEPTTEEPTTEEPTTEEPTTEEPTTEEPTTEEPTTEEPTTEEPTTEEPTTEEPTTEEPTTGNDGESFFARLWNFLVRIYRYIVNVFKTIFGVE